jgi:hypothetical protein
MYPPPHGMVIVSSDGEVGSERMRECVGCGGVCMIRLCIMRRRIHVRYACASYTVRCYSATGER